MPTNLNALIRYKTINSCLYGGRRWTIEELIEACSNALADARGRYEPISERTIRDDLRIMRSDILEFNAPIKQESGHYFYWDPYYTIMNISISNSGLMDQIIKLLIELRATIQHPELESVLEKLSDLSKKRSYISQKHKEQKPDLEEGELLSEALPSTQDIKRVSKIQKVLKKSKIKPDEISEIAFLRRPKTLEWGEIFKILG